MAVLLLVGAFIVSLIPVIALYLWMKKKIKDDPLYQQTCRKALIKGMWSTVPVVICSLILNILVNVIIKDRNSILYISVYNFTVLALSEEACKLAMMLKLKKDSDYKWSWMETMIFMTCVGIGFELLESGVYGLMTNPIQMFVRGITMMHAVFGMIMGYFWGRGEYTGKKIYYVLAFVLPWVFHGLYDLSLKDEIFNMNDFTLFLPFILTGINMVVLFLSIKFMKKNRDNEMYMTPASDNTETI